MSLHPLLCKSSATTVSFVEVVRRNRKYPGKQMRFITFVLLIRKTKTDSMKSMGGKFSLTGEIIPARIGSAWNDIFVHPE
ncbi:MAG: hypothetical protein H6Q07_2202 [Acidobacteria bacterium]|nr:hypothetical protein [Acidobacteriota bacterium]